MKLIRKLPLRWKILLGTTATLFALLYLQDPKREDPTRGWPNLGRMENTPENRRKAALTFIQALKDSPNQTIVKVYVAPAPKYRWEFFQYDRKARKAYFGPGGLGSLGHNAPPTTDAAYLVCEFSEEEVQSKLQAVADHPDIDSFEGAFSPLFLAGDLLCN